MSTPNWRHQAACHGQWDVFFGPDGETTEQRDAREAQAIAICRPCPVRQPCLVHALSRPSQHGVAGGVGEERRKDLRHALLNRQWRQKRNERAA